MRLSKIELIALVIAFVVGMHFYTQYKVEKELPDNPVAAPLYQSRDGGPEETGEERPPRILAFGDSLTAGVGAPPGEGYPEQLSRMLGVEVINAGKSGETTAQGLKRLDSVLRKYRPTVVLLEEGANDILRGRRHAVVAKNLVWMIKKIRKYGAKPVLIGFPDPDMLDLMIGSDLGFYEEVAEKSGADYIRDVFGEVLRDPELKSDDFVHPNARGYRIVAEKIYQYFMENPL
ncbi:arylesterase [Hydrogenimonas sp.]